MKYGWIWTVGEYELKVNMNYGWNLGWIHHKRDAEEEEEKLGSNWMGEYELWVNMNYMWIWIMGDYDFMVSPRREHQDKLSLKLDPYCSHRIFSLTWAEGEGGGPSLQLEYL